ncbi:ornithine cyclodeaminase family protein [Burkholderia plantarii]|uniref:ornithine cyclodeaminase family protein n=1 Tax=Burkholderia plantarii TaxID=41899 RepID=UPI0018DC16B2|nr:ornithine cyclodeaminase family protein [Burkholderia plantarii]MBI0330219.1 ornithine cyclodeaminase family protein [Burkholderia plantarii]
MRNDAELVLLDKNVVEALLSPDDVLDAVAVAFDLHRRGEGRVFPVIREPLATGGVFGIKAGDVQGEALLGFKAAGFWPANRGLGGEPHQATVMLVDPATGRPRCVIDGNAITTMRTGAAGGLGLRALARPDSRRVVLFGSGVQARVQLDFALRMLPSLDTVRYLTAGGTADPAFEARFRERCAISHARDADAAVAASDVVITATPGGGALFAAGAVRPGTHVNAVGADTKGKRELPAGLLERARLVVDDRAQARQIGEAQWAPRHDCVELGELLAAPERIARGRKEITVFDMTGLALQDLTVARMLFERAEAARLGTRVAWPW